MSLINKKMSTIADNLCDKILGASAEIVNTKDHVCRNIQLSNGKSIIKIVYKRNQKAWE